MSRGLAVMPVKTRKARRTKDEMHELRDGLYELCERHRPLTLRHAFYLAIAEKLVEKTEGEYKTTGEQLKMLRENGYLPWSWIVDQSRLQRCPQTSASMQDALEASIDEFRADLWAKQPVRAEVWCEKAALAATLYPTTSRYRIPLMCCGGFSSVTFLHDTAEEAENDCEKPTYIFHIGDHDDSGLAAWRHIQAKLAEYAPVVDWRFERLAVREEQIAEYNLPTRPPKKSSHGSSIEECVEVDAMPPEVLPRLLQEAFESLLPSGELARLERIEEQERETWQRMAPMFAKLRSEIKKQGQRKTKKRRRSE